MSTSATSWAPHETSDTAATRRPESSPKTESATSCLISTRAAGFDAAPGCPRDEAWDTFGMEQAIEIAGDMIRLGQLLKLAGVVSGGADAKGLIANGQVLVNGEPELRRGRQLHPGDLVRVGTADLRVVAA